MSAVTVPTSQDKDHMDKIFELIAGERFANIRDEIEGLKSMLQDMQYRHETSINKLSMEIKTLLTDRDLQVQKSLEGLAETNLNLSKKHQLSEKMIIKLHNLLSEETERVDKKQSKNLEKSLKEFKQTEVLERLESLNSDFTAKHELTEKMITRIYNVINQENESLRKRLEKKILAVKKDMV